MRRGWKSKGLIVGCLFVFLVFLLFFLKQTPLRSGEIKAKNFDQVTSEIYRGGALQDGDLEKLKDLGVKTIINFRTGEKDEEGRSAETLGLQYFSIPWSPSPKAASRYDYDQIAHQFLQLISAPDNLPVYVHCFAGKDRTGSMIAVYRMEHDGWSAEQAIQEMERYGFSRMSYPNLVQFLYEYERKLKEAVLTS